MSLIENERTKLTANAFNTVATSCVTVGVPAPLAAVFYNSGQTAVPLRAVAVGARIWMAAGCLMHYNARLHLRKAEAMTPEQWFAFVILPVATGVRGTIIAQITIRRGR